MGKSQHNRANRSSIAFTQLENGCHKNDAQKPTYFSILFGSQTARLVWSYNFCGTLFTLPPNYRNCEKS